MNSVPILNIIHNILFLRYTAMNFTFLQIDKLMVPSWRHSSSNGSLSFRKVEHLISPRFFSGVSVAHLSSFVCCSIMSLCVLSSVLWCPLQFPRGAMFGSYLHPVVCRREHVVFMDICVCLRIVVSNTYCLVLFFSVSCTLCCQFLWIVLF